MHSIASNICVYLHIIKQRSPTPCSFLLRKPGPCHSTVDGSGEPQALTGSMSADERIRQRASSRSAGFSTAHEYFPCRKEGVSWNVPMFQRKFYQNRIQIFNTVEPDQYSRVDYVVKKSLSLAYGSFQVFQRPFFSNKIVRKKAQYCGRVDESRLHHFSSRVRARIPSVLKPKSALPAAPARIPFSLSRNLTSVCGPMPYFRRSLSGIVTFPFSATLVVISLK